MKKDTVVGGNLPTHMEHLGHSSPDVLIERVQCRQALVARRDSIATSLLEFSKEADHALEAQILEAQFADTALGLRRRERQEQPHGVAIAPDRTRVQALLLGQVVEEEAVDDGAEGRGRHDCTSFRTATNCSKRRLASRNSSLVIVR